MHPTQSEEDFWARTIPEPNTGCWLWLGPVDGEGYGRLVFHGRDALAHQVAHFLATGTAPDLDAPVFHTCEMRSCCNPSHLRLVASDQRPDPDALWPMLSSLSFA